MKKKIVLSLSIALMLCLGVIQNIAFAGILENNHAEYYDIDEYVPTLEDWTLKGEESTWSAKPYDATYIYTQYYFNGIAPNTSEKTETELYQDVMLDEIFYSGIFDEDEYIYLSSSIKTVSNGGSARLKLTFFDNNANVLKTVTSKNINNDDWEKEVVVSKIPEDTEIIRASMISKKTTTEINTPVFEACFDGLEIGDGTGYIDTLVYNGEKIEWIDNPTYSYYKLFVCDENDEIVDEVATIDRKNEDSGYDDETESYSFDVSDILLEEGDYFRVDAINDYEEGNEILATAIASSCYEVKKKEDLTDKDLSGFTRIHILKNGNITGGVINLPVELREEGSKISGGTFKNMVTNSKGTILGGTFDGTVVNYDLISKGNFNGFTDNYGKIIHGKFYGGVTNREEIVYGLFKGYFSNYGKILDGVYEGFVSNDGRIENGTFNGVVSSYSGYYNGISGGVFNNKVSVYGNGILGGIFNETVDCEGGLIEDGTFKKELNCRYSVRIMNGNFKGEVNAIEGVSIYGGIFGDTVNLDNEVRVYGGTFNGRVNACANVTVDMQPYGNEIPTFNNKIYFVDLARIVQPCNFGNDARVVEGSNRFIGVKAYINGELTSGDNITYGTRILEQIDSIDEAYVKSKNGTNSWSEVTKTDEFTLQPIYIKECSKVTLDFSIEGKDDMIITVPGDTYTLPDANLFTTNISELPKFLGWAYQNEDEVINTSSISITEDTNLKALWATGSIYEITGSEDLTDVDLTSYAQIWIKDTGEIIDGIIDLPVYNEGTISGGTYTKCVDSVGEIIDGTFKGEVILGGTIIDGTFEGNVQLISDAQIEDGIFEGTVTVNSSGKITNGTFNNDVFINDDAQIGDGVFDKLVYIRDEGIIKAGTFSDTVLLFDMAEIEDGIFDKDVYLNGESGITDGTFNDRVYALQFSSINGGEYNETVSCTNDAEITNGTFEGRVICAQNVSVFGGEFNTRIDAIDEVIIVGSEENNLIIYGGIYLREEAKIKQPCKFGQYARVVTFSGKNIEVEIYMNGESLVREDIKYGNIIINTLGEGPWEKKLRESDYWMNVNSYDSFILQVEDIRQIPQEDQSGDQSGEDMSGDQSGEGLSGDQSGESSSGEQSGESSSGEQSGESSSGEQSEGNVPGGSDSETDGTTGGSRRRSTTTRYDVEIETNNGGTATATPSRVKKGNNAKIKILTYEGYELEDVKIDDISIGAVREYEIKNVNNDVFVKVKFKKIEINSDLDSQSNIDSDLEPESGEGNHNISIQDFEDVKSGDWFYDAVRFVVDEKIMNGTSRTTFEPHITTTRAMIVTILHRIENEPKATKENIFTDVKENTWYSEAIRWASENGIVLGIGNNQFAPDVKITREQLVTILYRYANYKNIDTSIGEDTNILSYDDVEDISEYAIPSMQWACGEGLISGVSETVLEPRGNATRAQVATIMMRFVKKIK